jgi:hypothetical protein
MLLFVARGAIHQAFSLLGFLVPVAALEAEAHVDAVGWSSHGHLADVAVAVLAILPGGDVGAVTEIHKVGQVCDLRPAQRPPLLPESHELVDSGLAFLAGDLNVLVATHALLHRRDASDRAVERARVAEKALYAGIEVFLVIEVDRLVGGYFSSRPILEGKSK